MLQLYYHCLMIKGLEFYPLQTLLTPYQCLCQFVYEGQTLFSQVKLLDRHDLVAGSGVLYEEV